MATTGQIARAKARVALAQLSGKQLPPEVIERAALNYSDAEPDVLPEPDASVERAEPSATEPSRAAEALQAKIDEIREHTVFAPIVAKNIWEEQAKLLRESDALTKVITDLRGSLAHLQEIERLPPVPPLSYSVPAGSATVYVNTRDANLGYGIVFADEPNGGKGQRQADGPVSAYIKKRYADQYDTRELTDLAVRSVHKAMSAREPDAVALPVDDDVRADLARRVARDIVSMNPEHARLIASAIEDELAIRETNEAAQDARNA